MRHAGVELIKEFCKNIGLDQPGNNVDVAEAARDFRSFSPGQESFIFQLSVPINVDVLATSHPVVKVFQEIQDRIVKSPLVRGEISSLAQAIDLQKEEIKTLKAEIENLQKYRTHYEMEYALRQGKEVIEVKRD